MVMEKETTMTTAYDITAFIDQWLVDNRDLIGDVSVDFALDVRNMIEFLAEFEIPEPVGV